MSGVFSGRSNTRARARFSRSTRSRCASSAGRFSFRAATFAFSCAGFSCRSRAGLTGDSRLGCRASGRSFSFRPTFAFSFARAGFGRCTAGRLTGFRARRGGCFAFVTSFRASALLSSGRALRFWRFWFRLLRCLFFSLLFPAWRWRFLWLLRERNS